MADLMKLVAAMERAKSSGRTDEEEVELADRIAYTKAIEDLMLKWNIANGGPLDAYDCIRGLAIALGLAIHANADVFGRQSRATVLLDMLQSVTDATILGGGL